MAKIAIRHAQIAKELNVKKINVGECGHAHKAFIVVADRVLTGDLNIPEESALPLLKARYLAERFDSIQIGITFLSRSMTHATS